MTTTDWLVPLKGSAHMVLERTASTSRYAPAIGFSSAVRAGQWLYLAGVTAISADGNAVGGDEVILQARECLAKIESTLRTAGASLDQVVHTRIYLTQASNWEAVGQAHGEYFRETPPAATMIVVKELLDPRMLVEIEAVAYVGP